MKIEAHWPKTRHWQKWGRAEANFLNWAKSSRKRRRYRRRFRYWHGQCRKIMRQSGVRFVVNNFCSTQ